MRIFIDIDGTILYEPEVDPPTDELDYQLVGSGIEEFLRFVLDNCEPYWLSARARLGRRESLETYILPHLPPCAAAVPVAYWNEFKHEALDPSVPFLWFDDYPEAEDITWLERHGRRDSLIDMVHTNPDNPARMLETVRQKLARAQRR